MAPQGYITAKEYAERLEPSITTRRVNELCNQDRIKGAFKLTGKTGSWVIPENAPDPREKKHRKD